MYSGVFLTNTSEVSTRHEKKKKKLNSLINTQYGISAKGRIFS